MPGAIESAGLPKGVQMFVTYLDIYNKVGTVLSRYATMDTSIYKAKIVSTVPLGTMGKSKSSGVILAPDVTVRLLNSVNISEFTNTTNYIKITNELDGVIVQAGTYYVKKVSRGSGTIDVSLSNSIASKLDTIYPSLSITSASKVLRYTVYNSTGTTLISPQPRWSAIRAHLRDTASTNSTELTATQFINDIKNTVSGTEIIKYYYSNNTWYMVKITNVNNYSALSSYRDSAALVPMVIGNAKKVPGILVDNATYQGATNYAYIFCLRDPLPSITTESIVSTVYSSGLPVKYKIYPELSTESTTNSGYYSILDNYVCITIFEDATLTDEDKSYGEEVVAISVSVDQADLNISADIFIGSLTDSSARPFGTKYVIEEMTPLDAPSYGVVSGAISSGASTTLTSSGFSASTVCTAHGLSTLDASHQGYLNAIDKVINGSSDNTISTVTQKVVTTSTTTISTVPTTATVAAWENVSNKITFGNHITSSNIRFYPLAYKYLCDVPRLTNTNVSLTELNLRTKYNYTSVPWYLNTPLSLHPIDVIHRILTDILEIPESDIDANSFLASRTPTVMKLDTCVNTGKKVQVLLSEICNLLSATLYINTNGKYSLFIDNGTYSISNPVVLNTDYDLITVKTHEVDVNIGTNVTLNYALLQSLPTNNVGAMPSQTTLKQSTYAASVLGTLRNDNNSTNEIISNDYIQDFSTAKKYLQHKLIRAKYNASISINGKLPSSVGIGTTIQLSSSPFKEANGLWLVDSITYDNKGLVTITAIEYTSTIKDQLSDAAATKAYKITSVTKALPYYVDTAYTYTDMLIDIQDSSKEILYSSDNSTIMLNLDFWSSDEVPAFLGVKGIMDGDSAESNFMYSVRVPTSYETGMQASHRNYSPKANTSTYNVSQLSGNSLLVFIYAYTNINYVGNSYIYKFEFSLPSIVSASLAIARTATGACLQSLVETNDSIIPVSVLRYIVTFSAPIAKLTNGDAAERSLLPTISYTDAYAASVSYKTTEVKWSLGTTKKSMYIVKVKTNASTIKAYISGTSNSVYSVEYLSYVAGQYIVVIKTTSAMNKTTTGKYLVVQCDSIFAHSSLVTLGSTATTGISVNYKNKVLTLTNLNADAGTIFRLLGTITGGIKDISGAKLEPDSIAIDKSKGDTVLNTIFIAKDRVKDLNIHCKVSNTVHKAIQHGFHGVKDEDEASWVATGVVTYNTKTMSLTNIAATPPSDIVYTATAVVVGDPTNSYVVQPITDFSIDVDDTVYTIDMYLKDTDIGIINELVTATLKYNNIFLNNSTTSATLYSSAVVNTGAKSATFSETGGIITCTPTNYEATNMKPIITYSIQDYADSSLFTKLYKSRFNTSHEYMLPADSSASGYLTASVVPLISTPSYELIISAVSSLSHRKWLVSPIPNFKVEMVPYTTADNYIYFVTTVSTTSKDTITAPGLIASMVPPAYLNDTRAAKGILAKLGIAITNNLGVEREVLFNTEVRYSANGDTLTSYASNYSLINQVFYATDISFRIFKYVDSAFANVNYETYYYPFAIKRKSYSSTYVLANIFTPTITSSLSTYFYLIEDPYSPTNTDSTTIIQNIIHGMMYIYYREALPFINSSLVENTPVVSTYSDDIYSVSEVEYKTLRYYDSSNTTIALKCKAPYRVANSALMYDDTTPQARVLTLPVEYNFRLFRRYKLVLNSMDTTTTPGSTIVGYTIYLDSNATSDANINYTFRFIVNYITSTATTGTKTVTSATTASMETSFSSTFTISATCSEVSYDPTYTTFDNTASQYRIGYNLTYQSNLVKYKNASGSYSQIYLPMFMYHTTTNSSVYTPSTFSQQNATSIPNTPEALDSPYTFTNYSKAYFSRIP